MFLTTKKVVRRVQWAVYGSHHQGTHRGSGYCEDHFDQQYLIKVWMLFGIPIWSWKLDFEDVPVYASAQQATMGFTDWESKFREYIV